MDQDVTRAEMRAEADDSTYEAQETLVWNNGVNNRITIASRPGPKLLPSGYISVRAADVLRYDYVRQLAANLNTLCDAAEHIVRATKALGDDFVGAVELREIWLHCDELPDLFGEAMRTLKIDRDNQVDGMPVWYFTCNGEHFYIRRGGQVMFHLQDGSKFRN